LRRFRVAGRQIPPRLQPDDVVWHVGGNSKWAGAYQGKAQVLDFFARQAQAMGGMPSVEVHDVLGNDDHVVTLGTAKATAPDGSSAEWKYTQIFHIRMGRRPRSGEWPRMTRPSTRSWTASPAERRRRATGPTIGSRWQLAR
jgi:uncharacterized protein